MYSNLIFRETSASASKQKLWFETAPSEKKNEPTGEKTNQSAELKEETETDEKFDYFILI